MNRYQSHFANNLCTQDPKLQQNQTTRKFQIMEFLVSIAEVHNKQNKIRQID